MEFMCALSVNGSLAHYRVQKEGEEKYTATLRTVNEKQAGLPEEIILTKAGDDWQGAPPHPEIVQGVVQAIEAANPLG